jgi:hypothetical protein
MKQPSRFLFCLMLSAAFAAPLNTRACAGSRSAQSNINSNSENSTTSVQGSNKVQEKRTRTATQQKIDSQLLYALYRKRGEAEAKGVPTGELRVKFDEKGRAMVTIRARVSKALLAKIKGMDAEIVSSSERYNDIRANVPLERLEELAALKDVRAIMPAEEATTNK